MSHAVYMHVGGGIKIANTAFVHVFPFELAKIPERINEDGNGLKQLFVEVVVYGSSTSKGNFTFAGLSTKENADSNFLHKRLSKNTCVFVNYRLISAQIATVFFSLGIIAKNWAITPRFTYFVPWLLEFFYPHKLNRWKQ